MKLLRPLIGLGAIAFALFAHAQSPAPQSPSVSKTKSIVGAPGAPLISSSSSSGAGSMSQTKALGGQAAAGEAAGFVTQASESGVAEVEFSKLALSHASNAQVKSLATKMIDDHTKANERLISVAARQGIKGESALTAEHVASLSELGQKTGSAFDQAFLAQMASDHRKAIALFQQEAQDSNSELASFAVKTLPTLQHHANMIDTLAKQ
jgi:putative membrane protein